MENKQTILIVDDNADNLDIAAEILLQNGLNVIFAQSGKQALILANKFIPDLILLDIMMPFMDGYEVCEKLKENKQTKEIPLVFLTAMNETQNIVKGFELGAIDYISKPFIPKVLISRVKTHLRIHKQQKELQLKEKLLQESEAKLLAVINSIPDLIFYKDTESKYTGFNKAFAKFLVEKPENIIGSSDYDFYNQKDAKTFIDADKEIILKNKNVIFNEWTQDFEGNQIYLDTQKTPLIDLKGNIVGIVGVSRNITELKLAEQKLKEKEQKLSNIYDNANEGIFILQNNKIVFFNNKLIEILAYSKKDIETKPFFEFIHPEDRTEALEYYKQKINGKKIGKALVFRVLNPNNKNTYVKVNSKQIQWNDRDAVLGFLDDVTEQFLLQKELKESKERLSLSQKAGKIGAWEWDLETDKIRWSDITFKIFGIKKDSPYISNDEFWEYVYPADKERILKEFDDAIASVNSEHKTQYRIINESGKICWLEEASEITYNELGKPIKMIGVLQDVTHRKLTEIELKKNNVEIKKQRDEIISSIKYAQTIQTSLLPEQSVINKFIKNNFILYKPKDLVSGDFYYINKIKNTLFFSVADCTGHGVPGGFITMLGINSLHGILKEGKKEPAKILNCLRTRIKEVFKGVEKDNNNGMDIAFCSINTETNVLQYAGAFNPLWIVRNNELIEIKATRNPVGFYPAEQDFANHTFQLQNKDKIYLFSDGYKDQIGVVEKKKFNNKRFKELILETSYYPIEQQKVFLLNILKKWQANIEQIDDITIMGIEWEM